MGIVMYPGKEVFENGTSFMSVKQFNNAFHYYMMLMLALTCLIYMIIVVYLIIQVHIIQGVFSD